MDIEFKAKPDPDIERAFDWITSFLPAGEWERRKSAIEAHLEELFAGKQTGDGADGYNRLVGTDDRIGWYLYLVETSQHEPFRTEVNQAARVLPVFKRLGMDLDRVTKIGGIERQVTKMLGDSRDKADSVLFEILIALLWSKNDWKSVSFIEPVSKEKRPDLRVTNGGDEWFVELKRLTTNSGYSLKERAKWLRMWDRLKGCLVKGRYPFVLDITFHVELESLPDDFLLTELETKLLLVPGACELISNSTWDVNVRLVDFKKISEHLKAQYVKAHSRQLQELVGGGWERKKGFTFIMNSTNTRMNGNRGINQYVDEVHWAAAAYWHCDAPRATEIKARDIRGHLADAVSQFAGGTKGVVHVGLETPDGEAVEHERFQRIVNTLAKFDPAGKDLRWVYVHLYESYAPPDKSWYSDETIYKFGANKEPNPEPLRYHSSVVSGDDQIENGMHWLRDAP